MQLLGMAHHIAWTFIALVIELNFVAGNQKIVGGKVSEPAHKFPWLVSMQVGGEHKCAGTIYDKHWVMTAASCLESHSDLSQIKWVSAVQNLKNRGPASQEVSSIDVIKHPLYNKNQVMIHDIALVRVSPFFIFNNMTAPTNLPNCTFHVARNSSLKGTIAGWGATQEHARKKRSTTSDELMEVEVPIWDLKTCQETLGYVTDGDGKIIVSKVVTPSQLCAGDLEGGKGPCTGDNGGPLMTYDEPTKIWTQVGIFSFSVGCAKTDRPGVYTKVSAYLDFMTQNLQVCKPRDNMPK